MDESDECGISDEEVFCGPFNSLLAVLVVIDCHRSRRSGGVEVVPIDRVIVTIHHGALDEKQKN